MWEGKKDLVCLVIEIPALLPSYGVLADEQRRKGVKGCTDGFMS